MTTDEFEALLEGSEESDTLEFKAAMAWDALSLAKDVMAMANTVEGGRIIFGIEDRTLVRQGLSPEQIRSFDVEQMRDQMVRYADPSVTFRLEIVNDNAGLAFAVLTVDSFDEIPVICRSDAAGLQRGAIYYRSRSGRPASAPVSNSNDMRTIIQIAVGRMRRNLQRAEVIPPDGGYDFDAELGGL